MRHFSLAGIVWVCLSLLTASFVLGCVEQHRTSGHGSESINGSILLSSIAEVNFGVVSADESRSVRFWIRNSSKVAVRVSRWRTSCNCVIVQPRALSLPPAQRVLCELA